MTKTSKSEPVGAFDLLPKSLSIVKKNLGLFLVVYSVPLIMAYLQAFRAKPPVDIKDFGSITITSLLGVSATVATVLLVASLVLQVMSVKLQLRVAVGKKTSFGELWDTTVKYFFPFLGLSLVTAFLIIGGLVLLIIPGILAIRNFILAPYFMIDQDVGIVESLKRSRAVALANSGPIWGLLGVLLLINVGPEIFGKAGGIIAVLLTIAYSVAPALRYFELKNR